MPSIIPSSRRARLILAGLAALVVLALTYTAGVFSAGLYAPGENSPEAGFARDMSLHHAQAVEMGMLAYQKATNAEVRHEGYDIALTQQSQIGTMKTWLDEWHVSRASDQLPMAWMPSASAPTRANRMIGPQLRSWLTLIGVIGLRAPPLPPALVAPGRPGVPRPAAGRAPLAAPVRVPAPLLAEEPALAAEPALPDPAEPALPDAAEAALAGEPGLPEEPEEPEEPESVAPPSDPDFSTGASLGLPPGFVLDGRRVPPPPCGVLMLMKRPRHMEWSGKSDPGRGGVPHCDRHTGSPPDPEVYPR